MSKQILNALFSLVVIGEILGLTSCTPSGQTPPVSFIIVNTYYKSSSGADLLNPNTVNSFKKQDLNVVSEVNSNGTIKEVQYAENENGINIFPDDKVKYYFELAVPTNAAVTPIATYITLSPADTDTVTYTFNGSKYQYVPDKIYYNKKLVWDVVNAPSNGSWPSIIIVK